MKPETNLKRSIQALDNFGVYPIIITGMLKYLSKITDNLKGETVAKEHFRKQRDEGLIELSTLYPESFIQEFAEWTSLNFWHYVPEKKLWINVIEKITKTTSNLLSEFKGWKEANK